MSETIEEKLSEQSLKLVYTTLQESAAQRTKDVPKPYVYEPNGPASYLELSLVNGQLIVESDDVMTSVVAPYVKHYVLDKIAKNEKMPYEIGMAILNLGAQQLEMYYGKYVTQKMRDKVREYMASPEQLPDEALGIGGVDVDLSDLANTRAA